MGVQFRVSTRSLSERCSEACRKSEEKLSATVGRSSAWLLVEVPGHWPGEGLPEQMPGEVAQFLQDAKGRGVRLQLIQKAEAAGERQRPAHRIYVAWSKGDAPDIWMETRDVDTLDALLELDVEALIDGRRPGFGSPSSEGVLLVCTHGSHDRCCGKLGYPIVRGIAKESGFASRVWRTTHVGGDRFAPNLVCLPYGTYHGQVPLEDATLVAEYSLKGRVMLPYYRGRAGYSYAAQRADAWARKCRGGGDDVFGVSYLGEQSLSDDMTMVHLAVGGMELQVPVRAHQLSKRPMSCGGPIGQPTAYEVEVEDCRQGP